MISVIIIDDEPNSSEILKIRLEKYSHIIQIVGIASNIDEATHLIQQLKPDVIFLDIHMPSGSGFDLLKRFPEQDFLVIFVTAYDQYALQALKMNALDYILKPIDPQELDLAIQKIQKTLSSKDSIEDNLNLLRLAKSNFDLNEKKISRIILPFLNGFEVVNIGDILYFEADRNYTKIVFTDNTEKLISKTLKDFESLLEGTCFFRIHQSYLVNLNYVQKYYKGKGGYVIMTNGKSLNVSRVKKEEFLKKIIGAI